MSYDNDASRQLGRIADKLADDLGKLSDAELLAETREIGLDPKALAVQAKAAIERAMLEHGKKRLAAARAAATAATATRTISNVTNLSLEKKRTILNQFAANDVGLREKLTLAARKGDAQSERDIDSFLQALFELGVIDDQGRMK